MRHDKEGVVRTACSAKNAAGAIPDAARKSTAMRRARVPRSTATLRRNGPARMTRKKNGTRRKRQPIVPSMRGSGKPSPPMPERVHERMASLRVQEDLHADRRVARIDRSLRQRQLEVLHALGAAADEEGLVLHEVAAHTSAPSTARKPSSSGGAGAGSL